MRLLFRRGNRLSIGAGGEGIVARRRGLRAQTFRFRWREYSSVVQKKLRLLSFQNERTFSVRRFDFDHRQASTQTTAKSLCTDSDTQPAKSSSSWTSMREVLVWIIPYRSPSFRCVCWRVFVCGRERERVCDSAFPVSRAESTMVERNSAADNKTARKKGHRRNGGGNGQQTVRDC